MKTRLRYLYKYLVMFGIDLRRMALSVRGMPRYLAGYLTLKRQREKGSGAVFRFAAPYPCLDDYYADSGVCRGHYFYQDWLVAHRIFANKPQVHVDIGSRVDGLVAHVAVFRDIEVLDIRQLDCGVDAIRYRQADLTKALGFEWAGYCDSLSSLHAVEHFGLGRYADSLDYYGYLKGLENMYFMLKKGGKFYFSVPIGKQRIEYNAHRVFSIQYLLEMFEGKYRIDEFSYVDDAGNLHRAAALGQEDIENNFDCHYGCGIFEMTKI